MRISSVMGCIVVLLTLPLGCEKSDQTEVAIDNPLPGKQIVPLSDYRTVVVHIEGFKKSKSGAI